MHEYTYYPRQNRHERLEITSLSEQIIREPPVGGHSVFWEKITKSLQDK